MFKVLSLIVVFGACALAASTQNKQYQKYVRPCHPVTAKCVRDNLAANSNCNPAVPNAINDDYKIETFSFDTPYFNSSYIEKNLVIKNQSKCYPSEFFFNVEADTAVLTVDCPGLVLSSNRTLYQHNSGKEDSVYSLFSSWEYPLIRFTVYIKNANAINICQSTIFTDVTELPKFVVTPNDKPTAGFLSRDLSLLPIYEREMWSAKGPVVAHNYIRNFICNFGC